MRYSDETDGLRALAVIAVAVNRFPVPLTPNGFSGTDALVVISGVVTPRLLHGRSDLSETLRAGADRSARLRLPAP